MKKETVFWILLAVFAFLFSSSLMWQTFSYDTETASLFIAPKAWSDFAAHIPLIRSFSLGNNWPPESPIFPGSPIQYHFLFYFLVGMLEKIGIRIDIALNTLSVFGLSALMLTIALMAKKLFSRYATATIAVLLFCFNGSLSFVRFFEKHPLSSHTLQDIVTNTAFPAFGPWDGGLVSAFWTMNIYTNQRHLGLSYALVLITILLTLKTNTMQSKVHRFLLSCSIALSMITLLFLNQAAALIAGIWLLWICIIQKKSRIPLLCAALISIPSIFVYTKLIGLSGTITFDPGYLVHNPLTLRSIVVFWWQNLGLSFVMIPFGFIVAPKKVKILFIVPLLLLFIAPNLWRFSPDMINNHKFFNFFIIVGNLLTAHGLVKIFDWLKKSSSKIIRILSYWVIGLLAFILTLSGIIDLFPIFNETKGSMQDAPNNRDVEFFRTNTPPDAVILNSTWLYHPASLAGRKIFAGYTYFTWSYGYNQTKREMQQKSIYEATNKEKACYLLQKYHIGYIELSRTPEQFLQPNNVLFENEFVNLYTNTTTGMNVYDVAQSCNYHETTN
ncbi:MAG: hypothetical protein WAV51_05240 [Microgenomates group bacterium]